MTNNEFSSLLDAALLSRSSNPIPQNEANKLSVAGIFRDLMTGTNPTGHAAEVSRALCRADGVHPDSVMGCRIPFSAMLQRGMIRDLSAGNFAQGGATVGLDIGDPIEVMLNRATAARCGAKTISGLRGNVALPRQTSAPSVYSLAESATATKGNVTFDQVLLTPHKITGTLDVTRQLVLQSSIGVENLVRDMLASMISLKLDSLYYYGSGGGSEPVGIVNTAGVGAVNFGGAATYAKIVDFEGSLAASNADTTGAKLAYVTSPLVRTKWKTTAKLLTGATTVAATPLWETGSWGDDSGDGLVNGARACASNQVQNNGVIFGNFADSIIGIFGNGIELIANPYSRDTDAVVRLTVHLFADVAFRHPQSFCVSTDAGNQ